MPADELEGADKIGRNLMIDLRIRDLLGVRSKERIEDHSPGNAGIVIVDTSDFSGKPMAVISQISRGGSHDP